MTYNPLIPQPTDFLSDSQQDLLDNFGASNTTYGSDHYAFDVLTANAGKHKMVTTPDQTTHPATVGDPKFYAVQDDAVLTVLQYSKGQNDAVPTAVTELQSPSTPLSVSGTSSINILDFGTVTKKVLFSAYATGQDGSVFPRACVGFYNGTTTTITSMTSDTSAMRFTTSGKILKLQAVNATLTEIYWSVKFHRIW